MLTQPVARHSPLRQTIRGHGMSRLRTAWPIAVVLVLFAATALIVPTLAPVATTDDWGYSRPVQILVHDHTLRIFPVVAATAIFQVLWGSLFALVFGATLGVVRLSTVVMVGLGGLALYGLCRELGISRGRSALGAAAYLFNPLGFVLAYTFMTDPHFTALLIIATYWYVRGLNREQLRPRAIVAGSVVASFALLTRQQGVLIPLAIGVYLVVNRRLRLDRASVGLALRITGLPLLAGIGYLLWLRYVNDVPSIQQSFLDQARHAGLSGTWTLVKRLSFFSVMYIGLFTLPLTAALLASWRRLASFTEPAGWLLFCLWEAILLIGLTYFNQVGSNMPYAQQFLGTTGLGAPDIRGSRPALLQPEWKSWLTAACAVSAVIVGMVLGRKVLRLRQEPIGIVLAVGLGQLVGTLPPSYHYLGWTSGTLDRYLLPLLPFAICLVLYASRDLDLARPVAILFVSLYALFAIAGTRDYLVYMRAVWNTARYATAQGVPLTQLDAGAAWDGYHLYEYSLDHHIQPRSPRGSPWWTSFYGPATNSQYVVAGKPIAGYQVVTVRAYSSWLQRQPTRIYLLHRPTAPWPPQSSPAPEKTPASQPLPPPPVQPPSNSEKHPS